MVERRAYAKINLFLDIESRRTDGYHNIKSVMQTVDWFDVINISLATTDGIHITSNDKNVPTDSSNIVFRACKAFFARLGYSEGVNIHIEKNIPMSAGMAGGSADGAATLEGLNELLDSPFSTETLIDIGKDVGADIPFCIVGDTKIISGIGEIIENCAPMPECYIVCAKQNDGGVSTPQAYKQLDEKYDKADVKKILLDFAAAYDESDDQTVWFDKVKAVGEALGYVSDMKAYKASPESYKGNVADVSSFIRLSVTGRLNSPDMYEVMKILGKDRVVKRLQSFAETL